MYNESEAEPASLARLRLPRRPARHHPIKGRRSTDFMGYVLLACLCFWAIIPGASAREICIKPYRIQNIELTEMDGKDVFAEPVSTAPPPPQVPAKHTHHCPQTGISAGTRNASGPIGTNKFYANFFLDDQSFPAYVLPYTVFWAKGRDPSHSYGLGVSHVNASQRVYGEPGCSHGEDTARYFFSPPIIQNVVLDAAELGPATTLTLDNITDMSAVVNLWPHAGAARPAVQFPLVQGMGFVTGLYDGARPVIHSVRGFRQEPDFQDMQHKRPGADRFLLDTLDGSCWVLYAQALQGTPGLNLTRRAGPASTVEAQAPFYGSIQVARCPARHHIGRYDLAAGVYATGVQLSGTTYKQLRRGSYTLDFRKADAFLGPETLPLNIPPPTDRRFEEQQPRPLLMFALPHHLDSFHRATHKGVFHERLQTPTKGVARAVLGDSWTMLEMDLPVEMDFMPWDPETRRSVHNLTSDAVRQSILESARRELLDVDMDAATNVESMYFSGKALAKFATLVVSCHEILDDRALAAAGLARLKRAFGVFVANAQPGRRHPLAYDEVWGGVVTTAAEANDDPMADFGSAMYNDHHFHYGYFVYAGAVLARLDGRWLTEQDGANAAYVDMLVRDYANPSRADAYFPVFRAFDWYHGHSWAHGLFASMDGKNEESSSEDAMAVYALKMWGEVRGGAAGQALAARSTLQLAVLARSLQAYFYYARSQRSHQPARFVGNKVAGVLFENKVDHTTFFGYFPQYVHGIHMLPLLPVSALMRPAAFVEEEWEDTFSDGRVHAGLTDKNWAGVLYGNLAVADAEASYAFFSQDDFDWAWIDGGASRTWYLTYAAALAGM